MFVLRASVWRDALQRFRPDLAAASEAAFATATPDAAFLRFDTAAFAAIPADSIDYAVMEPASRAGSGFEMRMVPLAAGWSDLGAWDAVWQVGAHDADGNAVQGDAVVRDSRNTLVHATSRLVGVIGVDDVTVVETADAVLVAHRSKSPDVKDLVATLSETGRSETSIHRRVHRPWGWYENIDRGPRFQVKRILVKPGARLSLQMHHHRAEHWIVVSGTAEVTNGTSVTMLSENQSTYIPLGQTHRLANPGKMALEIIEVQSGSYLGEDDIVRFEDSYGAAGQSESGRRPRALSHDLLSHANHRGDCMTVDRRRRPRLRRPAPGGRVRQARPDHRFRHRRVARSRAAARASIPRARCRDERDGRREACRIHQRRRDAARGRLLHRRRADAGGRRAHPRLRPADRRQPQRRRAPEAGAIVVYESTVYPGRHRGSLHSRARASLGPAMEARTSSSATARSASTRATASTRSPTSSRSCPATRPRRWTRSPRCTRHRRAGRAPLLEHQGGRGLPR